MKGKKLLKLFNGLFEAKGVYTFQDLKIPTVITAFDIVSGEEVYFSNIPYGNHVVTDVPIAQAVMASCSFPVVFRPIAINNNIFVDGGVLDNLPVEPLNDMGVKRIAAISLDRDAQIDKNYHKSSINIADRCINVMRSKYESLTDVGIDFTFKVKINGVSLLEMSKCMYCYQIGYDTGIKEMKNFIHLLSKSTDFKEDSLKKPCASLA